MNCRACEIEANDEQVKQMPLHTCGKDGPIELPKMKSRHDEGREEKPYFKLSKNEHGTMWLLYRPSDEGEGRYNCWEPINEKFWTEFESLLNDREQLAKERELRKELVEGLKEMYMHEYAGNSRTIEDAMARAPKSDKVEQGIIALIKKGT